MSHLTVSIVTPSFNQGRFIEETIKSVLNQHVDSLEYLVVDGGSTDHTHSILKQYQPHLKWISGKDNGQAAAINKGLSATSGDIIGWINSDDIYAPGAIKKVINFFTDNPGVDVVYGQAYFLDADGHKISHQYPTEPWNLQNLKNRCFLSQPAVFFRRRIVTQYGTLNEQLHFCLDYEYWLRLGMKGVKFYYLTEVLAGTRIHPEAKTSRFCLEAYFETVNMLRDLLGYVPSYWAVHYAIANAKSELKSDYFHYRFIIKVWLNLWVTSKLHYQNSSMISFWLRAHMIILHKVLLKLSIKESIKKYLRKPTGIIRKLIHPRIGVLYQYVKPRSVYIPNQYKHHRPLGMSVTISIVTPSFNQGHFLERTLLSVLEQKYPHLEYIVQDGGSKDKTLSILKRYQQYFKHVESKQDKGQSHALNMGFEHATGDIMAYLNSDDILLPGALHYVADYFTNNPEVDVVYGHRVLIDENDQEIGRWVLPPHDPVTTTWVDYIPQETLFWRRRIWEKVGGNIDESFKYAMDWDLILRFQAAGARFVRLPRFLGGFRVHHQQKTTANADIGADEVKRIRARVHGHQVTLSEINQNRRGYVIKHLICHFFYRLGIFRY